MCNFLTQEYEMKKILLSGWILVFSFVFSTSLFAQGGHGNHGGFGNFHPDSLNLVTVTGTAIVDTVGYRTHYYLDENDDLIPEYYLHFGMSMQLPDSLDVLKPSNGDTITVTGAVFPVESQDLELLIVTEINGELWRDLSMPSWNQNSFHHGHGGNDCGFHGFGFHQDSLETIEASGTVLVDTNFAYSLHYLDVDADQSADYFLNFGPPWYEPESGLTRPEEGESVTVFGGLIADDVTSAIIVYELDGEVWRDSTSMHSFAGGWITSDDTDSVRVHSPFDSQDWLDIAPGWNGNGHGGGHGGGGMMQDSLFMQMNEVFPWNGPVAGDTMPFAGYEVAGFTNRGRNGMMGGNSQCGGHFSFNSQTSFQFHYTDGQLSGTGPGFSKMATPLSEDDITVKAWDDETQSWYTVSDAIINTDENTVTFTSSNVSSNYVLTSTQTTGIEDREQAIVRQYSLSQNYPNPFNPTTTIDYSLASDAEVKLTVYDVTGRTIRTLTHANQQPGEYSVSWDSRNDFGQMVASGVYFYKLTVNMNGNKSVSMKKMILMR